MKLFDTKAILISSLVALFVLSYAVHYAFFRDADYIFKLLIEQIGSATILMPMIMIVVNHLLTNREKRVMLDKLNMVIGAFFSELGTDLLKSLRDFDPHADRMARELVVSDKWSPNQFAALRLRLKRHHYSIEARRGDLESLRSLLVSERRFLLGLLENPTLLEHESFTALLWAVFHLADELTHRSDLKSLPDADYSHLSGDINRAYTLLIYEWLAHMDHLRRAYPYLIFAGLEDKSLRSRGVSGSPVRALRRNLAVPALTTHNGIVIIVCNVGDRSLLNSSPCP